MTDPTFYRSPADAISAPPEKLAYVVAFDRAAERPDALAVLDTDPGSSGYGQVVGWADLPTRGDELHHFGWNACSSALAHAGHHLPRRRRRGGRAGRHRPARPQHVRRAARLGDRPRTAVPGL
jgi:selenium-binding protein 1